MLILYNQPNSTCSRKVRLCLREKGLSWDDKLINLQKFEHHDPEYLEINPNGVIPALVHDGKIVLESSVINEYIDDVFDEVSMKPTDPYQLALMRVWNKFVDDVALPAIMVPTWSQHLLGPSKAYFEAGNLDEKLAKIPLAERRERYKRLITETLTSEEFAAADENLSTFFNRFEAMLDGEDSWLFGDSISLADINSFPYVDRGGAINPSFISRETHPKTRSWFIRMLERPSVIADQSLLIPQSCAKLA